MESSENLRNKSSGGIVPTAREAATESTMSNGQISELPILPGASNSSTTATGDGIASNLPTSSALNMTAPQSTISAQEIALYDRQIRLWGMKAQELIRNADVLLIGMRALGNEIAKNLVLAGIGSLTVLDHEEVTEEDLGSQFLITEEDVGKNRAEAATVELRKMNPRVVIVADTQSAALKSPDYFAGFQIVITTGLAFELASAINLTCRTLQVKFYTADVYGMYGYIFADLIQHQFMIEKDIQGNIPTKPGHQETSTRVILNVETKEEGSHTKEIVTKQESYCPLMLANSSPLPAEATKSRRSKLRVPPILSCIRGFFDFQKATGGRVPGIAPTDLQLFTKLTNDKHLELQLPHETLNGTVFRSFLQNLGTELTATAAFLGGQVAQDVINVLGQREQPLQNFMVFDGEEFKSPIYSLQPILDPTFALTMNPPLSGINGVDPNFAPGYLANGNGNGAVANGVEHLNATEDVSSDIV